jgi:hypothetical protein
LNRKQSCYPSFILFDYFATLHLIQAWHRIEDEATVPTNSASDSPVPLSPPPQFEQIQEKKPIPLVALSEATADESSIAPSVNLIFEPPLPEPISSDTSTALLSPSLPAEAARKPRSMENNKALILNANSQQKHISSHSHSKCGTLEEREKGTLASESTASAAFSTEVEE